MKACPFCAENIQDAAIVCKHCQRDLVARPAAPAKRKTHWFTWIVLIVIGSVVGLVVLMESGVGRQDYLAFDLERQQWHARCDQYVNKTEETVPFNEVAEYRQCASDLKRMMATAREKGWAK